MQTIEVCKGKVYAVTSPAGCTVTDDDNNTLATVDANVQKSVVATGQHLYISDDTAKCTAIN